MNILRVTTSRVENKGGSVRSGYTYTLKLYTRQDTLYITVEGKDLEELIQRIGEDVGELVMEGYDTGEEVIVQWL